MPASIPVVSLADFRADSPARRNDFVQTMGDALADIGFFALQDHGIDDDLLRRAYDVTARLFDQPLATLQRYEDPAWGGQRGYTGFGREHAKDSEAPDLKEFWHVGRDDAPALPIANVWPAELPAFRPVMQELYRQLDACADALLHAGALYLGAPPRLLADAALQGDTVLRIIHYPPVPPDRHPASVRAAAHEDINLMTLLCEATAGGLELQERDGSWRPIHALQGQIVVDSGDMLQRWSNGLFRSTTHRVVNPDDDRQRRFSMPFFVHPRPEIDISPLAVAVARTGGVTRFEPTQAGAYLAQRLREIGLTAS